MENFWVVLPILPIKLETSKPKHWRYPKEILTVGDELRKVRMDRGLTQHQIAKIMSVNRNFVYELELGKEKLIIFALHKVYGFLGYIPKTLKINKNGLSGKLFAHRIKNNFTYSKLAEQIRLDKNSLIRVEKGKTIKQDTKSKVIKFLKYNYEE